MDNMKMKFIDAVAARLAAAPRSTAKAELIEELSDNLYRRFLDMTGAGMPEKDAFQRAMDDLGDVDELLAYLGTEPGGAVSEPNAVQTRTAANIGSESATDGQSAQGGAPHGPQDPEDGRGGAHYDRQSSQRDLDAILTGVSQACNTAIDQAKLALRQARDAVKRRTTLEKDSGHVRVHFNTHPNDPVPPEPPEAPVPPEAPKAQEPPAGQGWQFEAELDSDQRRFFAGGGPRQRKDVVYGFGYDKTRGGFYTQWGEYQDGCQDEPRGPRFSGEGSRMEHQDDGSYSVTALKDLRGIEVFTMAGDVEIHLSESPDAGVIIDGDVDDLNVTCSADGVLTIREGRTASSSFFSRRGIGSADVELYLPRRHWEMITVSTASGDVDIDRDGLDVDHLTVTTASGDFSARLRGCQVLSFKSTSGDLDLTGSCDHLTAETASGDIQLKGQMNDAMLKSASGDIELEGVVRRFHGFTMSGDVRVDTSQMPEAMEMSSKSGDVEARIPDAAPFSLRTKTISGDMRCEFPINYINGVAVYGDGSGPSYSMTTVSGDVSLQRY